MPRITSSSLRLTLTAWFVAAVTLVAPPNAVAQNPCEQIPPAPECFRVSVTPDGQSTTLRPPYSGPYTEVFTITNTGQVGDGYTITCGGSAFVTCTGTSTGFVSLSPSDWTTVEVYYTVAGPGTGSLTLSASSTSLATDGGSFTVPVGKDGVHVTPDASTGAV